MAKKSLLPLLPIPAVSLSKWVDFDKWRLEDAKQLAGMQRFAAPVPLAELSSAGKWTLVNSRWVWQVRVSAPRALALAFGFEKWQLPAGSQLVAFSPDKLSLQGAYDIDNNSASAAFMTGFVKGDDAVLAYMAPADGDTLLPFEVKNMYVAYEAQALAALDFGSALACQVNINCSEGATYQREKRGVVRIQVVTTEGVGWCSGSLMNNTAQNGKPLILSAFHCADGFTPNYALWTFFFNYEHAGCTNSSNPPALQSLQGCQLRAGRRETDFVLFELNQPIPTTFSPYFNGWLRDSTVLPSRTALIHHPQGDAKKISIDTARASVEPSSIPWNNNNTSPPRSHLSLGLDIGTIEGGSSGAPCFDERGRVLGQLHGGYIDANNPCLVSRTFIGWLSKSWEGASSAVRLKDWLDPLSMNPLEWTGTATPRQSGQISGLITTWWGQPLPRVVVYIGTDSATTDANGRFSFSNITLNTVQNVHFNRIAESTNGIDPADIILSRRHILGISNLGNPFSRFAGDIDDNGEIDAVDLLQTRRLLLGVINRFPVVNAWRFVPSSLQNNPDFPSNIQIPNSFEVVFSENTTTFNFIAVKMGDINGSADTNN